MDDSQGIVPENVIISADSIEFEGSMQQAVQDVEVLAGAVTVKPAGIPLNRHERRHGKTSKPRNGFRK